MRPGTPPSPLQPRRVAGVALMVLFLAGCAGAQRPGPTETVQWPPPPNKPRLKYVRSLVGTAGFDDRFWAKIGHGIFGTGNEHVVFNPNGVALSPDEKRLYVTNAPGFILEFDFERHSVRQVADSQGSKPRKPYGLAFDAEGNLYVTDQAGAVLVYSPGGKLLRRIGEGTVQRPMGIAIDRRRQIAYVVDGGSGATDRHQLLAFALDGRLLRTIGKRGLQPGEFLFPSFVTVSGDGTIYVADTMNGRVQAFDPDGNLVAVVGSMGDGWGQFGKPKGIAFDAAGNLHVVDGQLANVQIFNKNNQLLMPYGGQANSPELMMLPNGIAIDSKNRIFIADYAANRVNEYLLFDTAGAEGDAPAPGKPSPSGPGPAAQTSPPPGAPATPSPASGKGP